MTPAAPRTDAAAGTAGPEPAWTSPNRLGRYAALTDLATRRLQGLTGVRLGRVLGWVVGSGFGVAMVATSSAAADGATQQWAIGALGWICWTAAPITLLSAAQDLQGRDQAEGISALVQQRGHTRTALATARLLATIRVVLRSTAPPALLLALLALALSESLSVAAGRALLVLWVAGYTLLLAIVLGATARWASALNPRRGRTLAALFLLGPELARSVWPSVPSIPAWFEALFHELQRSGSALG